MSFPVSVLIANVCPFLDPIIPFPIGDSFDILPLSGSASKEPTIV